MSSLKVVALAVSLTTALLGAQAAAGEVVRLAATKPSNTALPTITGTAQRGFTLTASTGSWSGTTPMTFTYSWRRCNSTGASCTTISGATGQAYVLGASDVSKTIRVVVTATNSAGSSSATSNQTALIAAATAPANTALPTISGYAELGGSVTGSSGSWSGS